MPTRKNTSRAPSPQLYPLYIWPRPGDDLPRLEWSSWLRLISLEVGTTIPGAPGAFISQHILALAEHARVLDATDPESHERLAQAEADRESAWVAALEHEAAAPGLWEANDPDPDAVDGWGGHPQELCDDAASRYWVANRPDDDTFIN